MKNSRILPMILVVSIVSIPAVSHSMAPKKDSHPKRKPAPYCSVSYRATLIQQLLERGTPKLEHMQRQIKHIQQQRQEASSPSSSQ